MFGVNRVTRSTIGKWISIACILVILLVSIGCGGKSTEKQQSNYLVVPPIWHSAAEVEAYTNQHLSEAEAICQRLLDVQGERTSENTLIPYNDMLIEIDRVTGLSDLISYVHPEATIREAAEKSYERANKLLNDINLDQDLYQAVASVSTNGLDSETEQLYTLLLRDYNRAGVDKDDNTRQQLATLYEKIASTGKEFQRNIDEEKLFIEVSKDDLVGLLADFVASHQPGEDGKIKITTDYSDYVPFETYSTREDLRKDLYLKYMQCGYPANEKTLMELLDLRYQYATLLGYSDWAAYNAEDKMVKTEEVISDFIDNVVGMARPRMINDLSELLAEKKLESPGADTVHAWDALYYIQKVRDEHFGVDSREVRSYFELSGVEEGLLGVAQQLFGVTIKKLQNPDVWHYSVEAYDVFDGGQFIGRFYLDLFPREGKYSHEALFPVLTGVPGCQAAVSSLVANLPGPGTANEPAFLEYSDVVNLFHEFGHLMHHLLASKSQWVRLNNIMGCEWDFIEMPSQLMEEWSRDPDVLSQFARQYQTGQPIIYELVEKMQQAEGFGRGLAVMGQMVNAKMSLVYHNQDPTNINLLNIMIEIQKEYSPYPHEDNTYLYDRFTHLSDNEYSSAYYTYMWSLALVKDVFTVFQANGLMDKQMAMTYRHKVLEQGCCIDAADMIKNFLGRDYSFGAFEKWLQE